MPEISFPNYLQQSYDMTKTVRDQGGVGGWDDAWSNFMMNYALSNYTFAQNRQMAEEEYQRNLNMWNLVNEYNSPKSQMQRFAEAGLNPNLVYQQGSNGNANSMPSYNAAKYEKPDIQFNPQEASLRKIQGILGIVGAVNNVVSNIGQMIDTSMNLHLKQNQVLQSDFDTAVLHYAFPGAGSSRSDIGPYQSMTMNQINPLSKEFDPVMYLAYQRLGALPQFFNTSATSQMQREYLGFKSSYQDYYNRNLLPKFSEYNAGKLRLQSLEEDLQEYTKSAREMTPPWLKGILDPLFGYFGPLISYGFKHYLHNH